MIGGAIINSSVLGLESSYQHYLFVEAHEGTEFSTPVFMRERDCGPTDRSVVVGRSPQRIMAGGRSSRRITVRGRTTC